MTLCEHLNEHIAAAFTGLWIRSFEHEDALAEIAGLCRDNDWSLAVWDIDRGLQVGDEAGAAAATDPVASVPVKSVPLVYSVDQSDFHTSMVPEVNPLRSNVIAVVPTSLCSSSNRIICDDCVAV